MYIKSAPTKLAQRETRGSDTATTTYAVHRCSESASAPPPLAASVGRARSGPNVEGDEVAEQANREEERAQRDTAQPAHLH